MVAGTNPIKTPDGQAELGTRQRRLSQRHRTVLFLVDGKHSAAEVRSMARQAGVPEGCFDELLAMGLIMLPEPTVLIPVDPRAAPLDALHVDLPLGGDADGLSALPDSILPPSRTLYPESVLTDSVLAGLPDLRAWLPPDTGGPARPDAAFEAAREILLRAVRAEAPLAGSLTLRRLRRAANRADLAKLLDEVENRITKPHRALAATQTMRRVRELLAARIDSSLTPA